MSAALWRSKGPIVIHPLRRSPKKASHKYLKKSKTFKILMFKNIKSTFLQMTNFIFNIITFGLIHFYTIFIFTISVIFIHFSNKNVFGLTLINMKLLSSFNYFRNKFIISLDLILFILVVGSLIYDIFLIVSFFINKFTFLNK